MKPIFTLLLAALCAAGLSQPVGGTKLISNTAANYDYPNIQFAIYDCVTKGIANGGVIFNIQSGDTFIEPQLWIDSTFGSSATKPVIFRKWGNGPKPVIMTNGSLNPSIVNLTYPTGDAAFALQSVSHITFDGLKIADKPTYFFPSERLEFGFALYKSNTTPCRNITIKNCEIVFDASQQNQVGIYVPEYNGIAQVQTSITAQNRTRTIVISNNKITSAHTGISLGLYATSSSAQPNKGCVIENNTISNLTASSLIRHGIIAMYQDSLFVRNNRVHTSVVSSAGTYGITLSGTIGNAIVSYDTITVMDSMHTIGVDLTNLICDSVVKIQNNLITGSYFCYNTNVANAAFGTAIAADASIKELQITGNQISANTFTRVINNIAYSAGIVSKGSGKKAIIQSNQITNNTVLGEAGRFNGIFAYGAIDSLLISSNSITNQSISDNSLYPLGFYGIGGTVPSIAPYASGNYVQLIENNTIEQFDTATFVIGIYDQNIRNCIIRGNTIKNIRASSTIRGIDLYQSETNYGMNCRIENNQIYQLRLTDINIGSITGMRITSINSNEAGFMYHIINNMISGFVGNEMQVRGIDVTTNLQKVAIAHNSIHLSPVNASGSNTCSGAYLSSINPFRFIVQNNLIKISGTSGGSQTWYALHMPSLCSDQFDSTSNYNNLKVNSSDPLQKLMGGTCISDSSLNTVAAIANHHSFCMTLNKNEDVTFVNNDTDLHLSGASVCNTQLQVPRLSSVLKDIDGDTRAVNTFVGADEGITLNAVALQQPANTATNVALQPTFTWSAVAGAATYQLQVSTVNNFGSTVINQTALTGTTYTAATALQPGTTYYWRMRANSNAQCSGPWSVTRSFTTIPLPDVPVLVSPVNSATGVPLTPAFDWNDAANAATYEIQVSDNSGFTSPVIAQSAIATSNYTAVNTLAHNTLHYWRVRATNSAGNSAWSTVWTFTTINNAPPVPSVPVLVSPANSATGVALLPNFDWQDAANASTYQIQVSTTNNFATTVIDETGIVNSSYSSTTSLINNTTYYWRVRATNSSGNSAWSTVWTFETSTTVFVDEVKEIELRVYPNPVSEMLHVAGNSVINSIQLIDVNGRVMLSEENILNHQTWLNLSALSAGYYLCSINTAEGTLVKKILVK